MGKDSLLQSTSKKKSTAKKKDEEIAAKAQKKTAPAKKTAPKVKAAAKAKPKAAKKPKAAPKAKKAAAVRAKKTAPKTTPKKVAVKDLVQKKFDTWKPEKIFSVALDKKYLKDFAAPEFVTGPKEEVQRIKALLLKKFDLSDIKAAAEKAAVERPVEPEVSVSHEPPDSGEPTVLDPMDKAMKYLVGVFIIFVALIIGSSMINTNHYYINATEGALEIWQGKFSPMGEELLITLPGIQRPETKKDVYGKEDVYPIIFNYYVNKADALLEVPGMPDFEGIKTYLDKALSYATTKDATDAVYARLNNIDLMILLYKADVAASKATISDLEDARAYLARAAKLNTDAFKADLIKQKISAVDGRLKELQAKQVQPQAKIPEPRTE